MTVGLVLGDLDLVDPQGSPFAVETLADGTTWGNPQPIEVAVRSLLQDGSIVVHQGDDNREVSLRVVISAADSAALAEGEAALMAELYRPNTLTYTPADGWGPPTVFTVVTSSLAHVMDDLAEVRLSERHYSVRLVCEPFGRSEDEVTAEALPASGTTTTNVNNGSATTNWTGAVNGTSTAPSIVSGAVKISTTSSPFTTVALALTYTASIDTSSTKYLVVDWKPESADGSPDLRVFGDGIELTKLADSASPTAGFTRSWFGPVSAAAIAVLKVQSTSNGGLTWGGGTATRSLSIDNVDRTDIKPSFGTARQLSRQIEVTGSTRTQGSVAVEHATSALGDVLVYVYPDTPEAQGYSPSLRQYRTSGGTVTTDSTLVSGAWENISPSGGSAAVVFDIPLSRLVSGMHTLVIRAETGGVSPIEFSWTAQVRINSTDVGPSLAGSKSLDTLTPTAQTIYTLGRLLLPQLDVDAAATDAVVRLTLWTTETVFTGMEFDEAWLFNTDIGRLVQVSCGTGTAASGGPANRLFIEPATVALPRPSVRIGFAADRSDAYYPAGGMPSWQFPEFKPPRVNVFTVTTNALDASVSLRHYPHWHTHAVS